jgi:DNA-binding GntR family transcriptional regulator
MSGVERRTLASHVYETVRNAIVAGELPPGSLHSVNAIAERLEVSRTPVREALLKLEEQGMVKFERNRGARILSTSVQDLRELFSLRLLLEIPSAHTAAQRADAASIKRLEKLMAECEVAYARHANDTRLHLPSDAAFHREIALIAGSARLANLVGDIFNQQLIAEFTSADVANRKEEIVREHRLIVEAIANGDSTAAVKAMRDHLIGSGRALASKESGSHNDLHPIFSDLVSLGSDGILAESAD